MPPEDSAATQTDPMAGVIDPTPHQRAAPVAGPDSVRLPPNPLAGQGQATGSYQEVDWEARYKGLNRAFQDRQQEWQTDSRAKDDTIASLAARLEALENRQPAPAQEPQAPKAKSPAPEPQTEDRSDSSALLGRLIELEAERFKTQAVIEMMQPGQPGHGLDLLSWLDEIPIRIDGDGMPDQEAQRAAIKKMIDKINALRGDTSRKTQQAMVAGYTPGAAPGTPPPTASRESEIAEFYEMQQRWMDPRFDRLPEAEQAKIENRYYELLHKHRDDLPGITIPWMTNADILKQVKDTRQGLRELQTALNPKT